MKRINIGKQFGKFLMGRQEGLDAFIAFDRITKEFREKKNRYFVIFQKYWF